MSAPQSPIGSRRRLGAELRRLRRKSGLTLDEVADRMTCSTSKISRLETGKGVPKVPDVRELMRIYGVTSDAERDMLLRLVHDGREHGWWEPLVGGLTHERVVVDPSARYAGLESEARSVEAFELVLVHGLLQTPRYARAVFESLLDIDESEIARLLELRRRRQEILERRDPPLELSVVMDESVPARSVGSPEIMVEQLDHLIAVMRRPNVTLRILPFTTGMHRGAFGPFGVLGLPPESGSDLVFLEDHTGGRYLESEEDVRTYRDVFADLTARSLAPRVSRSVIARWRSIHQGAAQEGTGA